MPYPAVTRDEALAVECPVCQSAQGYPCTYVNDLFEYRPVKRLVHARGEEYAGMAHNARLSLAIDLRGPRERQPYGPGPKQGLLTDEEIAQQVLDGYEIGEVARRAGLSEATVRRRLRKAIGRIQDRARRGASAR